MRRAANRVRRRGRRSPPAFGRDIGVRPRGRSPSVDGQASTATSPWRKPACMHPFRDGCSRSDASNRSTRGTVRGRHTGHGDGQLAPLDSFGALVGRFQLGVHPLIGEESGTVLGDAVAAHQTDCFAHHVGAVARIPELSRGAEHVRFGVLEDEGHERVVLRDQRAVDRWD